MTLALTTVLICIGFLFFLMRQTRQATLSDVKSEQLDAIYKINKESEQVDRETNEKLESNNNPSTDPRAMWMRDTGEQDG